MNVDQLVSENVVVLGFPLDFNSSFLRGPALAPAKIREALQNGSSNWCLEDGRDLSELVWSDMGDLELRHYESQAAADYITEQVTRILGQGSKLLSLGGDHSVTFPIIRAFAAHYSDLTLLHIDAHPDLYHDFEGNPYSHASPFARIMEAGLVSRLVQVGIRTLTPHQREQASKFGVEILGAKDWRGLLPKLRSPLYISLDLDALDPAFAPGVSHHEPGGFSVREVLRMLEQISVPVVGADIVELNPTRDHTDRTAMVAAKFYKELVGKMLESRSKTS